LEEPLRIDKWLWAMRIYKTRSLASDACRAGKVKMKDQDLKPSKAVKIDEIYTIQIAQITKTVKVLALTGKRLSPKLVTDYFEDLTPKEEYQKPLLLKNLQFVKRNKGTGRPTKKERRELDDLTDW
jgi:ribosome-associated heat shock protein Hsp15